MAADLAEVDNELPGGNIAVKGNHLTNMYLEDGPYGSYFRQERTAVDFLQRNIIRFYRIAGIPLFLLACIGFILCLRKVFRKRLQNRMNIIEACFMLCMLGTAFAVAFGIAWFADFLVFDAESAVGRMKFYAVGGVPCILMFDLFGLRNLFTGLPFFNRIKD